MKSPWWQLSMIGELLAALFFAHEGNAFWLVCYGAALFGTYNRELES